MMLSLPQMLSAKSTTIKQEMEWIQKNKNVRFVYDAELNTRAAYHGQNLHNSKLTLQQILLMLFKDTEIAYEIKGNYVMLKKKETSPVRSATHQQKKVHKTYTVSGYVRDANGESLINATVYDQTTRQGTMTNAYGFYSITLEEGEHQLRYSYLGYKDEHKTVALSANQHSDIQLSQDTELTEVVVTGDLNSQLLNTQTGKKSLTADNIKTEFSLMSSPDVVKTLQRTSGVSEGIELASGLYVHGGNNDENLFLIDGSPLYQVNHSLGLFSSFNADVIKNVDFYKSGFPARYGGRLSSVVDVRTKDGDFYHTHGGYRIGLLDGSFNLEGPIRKGKTSFNFGLRRTWLDAIYRPLEAILNKKVHNDPFTFYYYFHDMNAKITNVFNERSRLSLSMYYGSDKFLLDYEYHTMDDNEYNNNKIKWGNLNASLDWEYQCSPKFFANISAIYTQNLATMMMNSNEETPSIKYKQYESCQYESTIHDLGYRLAFDYRPSPHHHIRFGNNFTWHRFNPQSIYYNEERYKDQEGRKKNDISENKKVSDEIEFYAEDEMTINNQWSLNAGLHTLLFSNKKKIFTVDPRIAVKYQPMQNLSFKASMTYMSQFVHKLNNIFLELPSDYWVPTTEKFKPMRSCQVTTGVYFQPSRHWMLSLEGYYKYSTHLLQYANWNSLVPPADKWQEYVIQGRGRYYGMEFDATYKTHNLTFQGSYTLSRNQRQYDLFGSDWYNDKFDNRHKINLSARWQITKKISAFGCWNFHSGNHSTIPTQYMYLPDIKDEWKTTNARFVYEKINNYTLSDYHRLDIGFDFHHITKHGHERIWNISLYNAYSHINTLSSQVKQKDDGSFFIKNTGYIPIIPSFSYTIKF